MEIKACLFHHQNYYRLGHREYSSPMTTPNKDTCCSNKNHCSIPNKYLGFEGAAPSNTSPSLAADEFWRKNFTQRMKVSGKEMVI
jgi:hypothetical protein